VVLEPLCEPWIIAAHERLRDMRVPTRAPHMPETLKPDSKFNRILLALPFTGATSVQIAKALGYETKHVTKVFRDAFNAGLTRRLGLGTKHEPYHYFLNIRQ
jgi:hypothetical protein